MNGIKTIWNKIDGNKTNIGVALMLLLSGIEMVAPNLIPQQTYEWLNSALLLLTGGVGLGHKAIKKYGKN